MAAITEDMAARGPRRDGLFLWGSVLMTLVIVAGFSTNIVTGRSSFGAPLYVHAHAVVFMGWVAIYLLQNVLVGVGRTDLHRRLGVLAAAWMAPMLIMGCVVTVAMARKGSIPFFFRPQQFLVFDPLSLVGFIGLASAGIALRRRSDWHRRLQFCGMSLLLGPGFGRLLPMPLMIPYAWEATMVACLAFPIVAMLIDSRRSGRIHPAWLWGLGAMALAGVAIEAVTYSPLGDALYHAVVAGSPGASVPGLAFPPPPGPPPGA